jgi:hypothetical protein
MVYSRSGRGPKGKHSFERIMIVLVEGAQGNDPRVEVSKGQSTGIVMEVGMHRATHCINAAKAAYEVHCV